MTSGGTTTFGNVEIKVFGSATSPDSGTFDIVHTNDIHGHYAVEDGAGAAVNAFSAVAAVAEDERAGLVLDAGDTFHGDSFATVNQGAAIAALMDAAGYDATTPGNHDWSYGSERLAEIDADASFSVMAANVSDKETGDALFEEPYRLFEVPLEGASGGLTGRSATVGVFGVIDDGFYGSTAPGNVSRVEFSNAVDVANETAEQLRVAGAEVVIALTHNQDPLAFAAELCGVDAVVAGHGHVSIDEAVTAADGRKVAVVEAASSPSVAYFGSIGLLSIEVERNAEGDFEVVGHKTCQVSTADVARANDKIDELTAALIEENAAKLLHEHGTCEEALRALIAQDGWEQTMTNLSGSVTYVTDGASGDAGGDTAGGSADASAGSASGPLALPATGDAAEPAAAVLLACALASALVAAAATRRARRERWRDAG